MTCNSSTGLCTITNTQTGQTMQVPFSQLGNYGIQVQPQTGFIPSDSNGSFPIFITIAVLICLAIASIIIFKVILPKTARYAGKLRGEFKNGMREKENESFFWGTEKKKAH